MLKQMIRTTMRTAAGLAAEKLEMTKRTAAGAKTPIADMFPAIVSGPQEFPSSRAVLAENRLRVWTVAAKGKKALRRVLDIPYSNVEFPKRNVNKPYAATVTTAEGVYTIKKGGGCGCGSPLKMPYNMLP